VCIRTAFVNGHSIPARSVELDASADEAAESGGKIGGRAEGEAECTDGEAMEELAGAGEITDDEDVIVVLELNGDTAVGSSEKSVRFLLRVRYATPGMVRPARYSAHVAGKVDEVLGKVEAAELAAAVAGEGGAFAAGEATASDPRSKRPSESSDPCTSRIRGKGSSLFCTAGAGVGDDVEFICWKMNAYDCVPTTVSSSPECSGTLCPFFTGSPFTASWPDVEQTSNIAPIGSSDGAAAADGGAVGAAGAGNDDIAFASTDAVAAGTGGGDDGLTECSLHSTAGMMGSSRS
jgi:hypothetical protein